MNLVWSRKQQLSHTKTKLSLGLILYTTNTKSNNYLDILGVIHSAHIWVKLTSLLKVTVQFTVKKGEESKGSLFLCACLQINATL